MNNTNLENGTEKTSSILSHKEYYHVFSTCAIVFFIAWVALYVIAVYGIEVSMDFQRRVYLILELMFVISAINHYSKMGKERIKELEDDNPFR